MEKHRSRVAVLLSFSLIVLSPGLGSYRAAASVVGSAAAPVRTAPLSGAGVSGAAGMSSLKPGGTVLPVALSIGRPSLPEAGLLTPSFSATRAWEVQGGPSAVAAAEAARAAGVSAPERLSPASFKPARILEALSPGGARAPPQEAKTGRGAFSGLSLPLPDFGKMAGDALKSAAGTDFLTRIGAFPAEDAGPAAAAPNEAEFKSFKHSIRLKAAKKSSSDEGMPDYGREDEGGSASDTDVSDLDELGNPRRRQSPGPDDTGSSGGYDEFGGDGGRSNSGLFGFAPLLLAGSGLFIAPIFSALTLPVAVAAYLGVLLPSLVLHEMGHAWLADKLGDSSARVNGRMSFSPGNLWNHLNKEISFKFFGRQVVIPLGLSFVMPIAMLAVSMLAWQAPVLFGGARPVQADARKLASPSRGRSMEKGMALVALAGPAVNLGLAAAAGLAHFALAAAGVTGVILPVLAAAVWLNVLLGIFNLLPFAPLDGHHIARYVLSDVFKGPDLAAAIYGTAQGRIAGAARKFNLYALVSTLVFLAPYFLAAVGLVSGVLLTGSSWLVATGGMQAAAAYLPAVGALGLMLGRIFGAQAREDAQLGGPNTPLSTELPDATELIVVFPKEAGGRLAEDVHLSLVDVRRPGGMGMYQASALRMSTQLEAAGLSLSLLGRFGATPIATYKRINAATLRLPASRAEALKAELQAKGLKVYDNERREIVRPIEDDPNIQKPQSAPAWGEVSMEETLKISTMDKVHEEARKMWGSPQMEGWRARWLRAVLGILGGKIAQPNIGVIDTGVDKDHPLIKPGLKAAKDVRPGGDGHDGNGHGTWVTSLVLWFAPWLKNITHYKIFSDDGGATLDDVLKGLTMAGNDGNIVISNSWGSDAGDPDSPDSLLVKKLGEEGHYMIFAGGNAGYSGANTIGSPAIVDYVAPKTGAPRVIAVAATDRDMAVTPYSSKGPGSRKTRGIPGYPRKPNAAEQGDKTEGAWPGGRTRAISGTSMSTPKFAGTIAMLAMLFGVSKTGEDLDRIVNAVMATLVNPKGEPETAIGDGFSAAYAAYQNLKASGFAPVRMGWLRRAAIRILDKPAPRGVKAAHAYPLII